MAQSTISAQAVQKAAHYRALCSVFWKARAEIIHVALAAQAGEQIIDAHARVDDAIWRLSDATRDKERCFRDICAIGA